MSGAASTIYDVIIAGAGPAGSTAAFILGEAGWNVLVLEKEKLPRYKACGGGISGHLLEQFPFSFENIIESKVKQVTYVLGKDEMSLALPDKSIFMVMRDNFDAYILKHASAKICTGSPVRTVEEMDDRVVVTTRSGERYEGRYLIGADGANSIVARSVGLRKKRRPPGAIEVEATVSPEVMERFRDHPMFVFGEIRLGYLWVFPKDDHLSVGIGSLGPKPGEMQSVLRKVMARFGIAIDGQQMHGHPLPIYLGHEKLSTRRVLLAGDAAGLVDPLTGEGIRLAVYSGKLAAQTLLSGHPERYSSQIFWKIGVSHLFAIPLALVFYLLPELCFALGVYNPYATKAFIGMLSGRLNYPQVIFRLFTTLPIHLVRESLAFARDAVIFLMKKIRGLGN